MEIRRGEATIGGFRTAIMEAGDGPPVLLVHGSSLAVDGWLTWFRTVPALARSRRVILYDQPGFGASEIPADGRYLDRMARAGHARALVEHLDLHDLTVVGHSEGGFIATRLAIALPERIAAAVVVTSGGTAPEIGDGRDQAWQAASRRAYDYIGRSVDEESFVRSEGFLSHTADPEFEAVLRRNFREAKKSGNLAMFVRKARETTGYGDYAALQRQWIFPYLDAVKARFLLVWGGSDPTVPVERGLALARLLPRSELHLFQDRGHWVMHEAHEGFNRLLDGWIAARPHGNP